MMEKMWKSSRASYRCSVDSSILLFIIKMMHENFFAQVSADGQKVVLSVVRVDGLSTAENETKKF